jgi:pantoate--beta-alanine ligase
VRVSRTIAEARATLRELPRPLGFVPTMGALHDGHLSLVDAARRRCTSVAASIFVNPRQFGEGEDFDCYPRDEASDADLLRARGVAAVFAPSVAEMYAEGGATRIHVGGPLTETFEGAVRPGHFDGVALVVTKLLDIVQPDVLLLGQKDAQQLAVIRRLVRDLDLPVEVVGSPIVREPDGLAMSSRNAYLTLEQRAVAPRLHASLLAGRAAAGRGAKPDDVVAVAAAALRSATSPRFDVDYMAIVDADTFLPETKLGPRSLLIAAARLEATRLIDNVLLLPVAADASTRSSSAARPPSAYPDKDATD